MSTINRILNALEEREIARNVGLPHDEARMRFRLDRNTIVTFDEFRQLLGEYLNYHSNACISKGGVMAHYEAEGKAIELVDTHYQRRRIGDIMTAFNHSSDGINGGLRVVLDIIADGLKTEGVERYIESIFDRYVSPASWDEKVIIIQEFIDQCGAYLSSAIRNNNPESYARDYKSLIRAYIDGLKDVSTMFRRL